MGLIIEILFLGIVLIILFTHINLKNIYKNLSSIKNEYDLSGFEIARSISSKYSKEEPHIIKKNGKYLDHYNAERNVIKLSSEVFDGTDMYAATIALNVAMETDKDNKLAVVHKLSSFIVLASYIIIVISACMNNYNAIHFGLALFIVAFAIELLFNLHNELDGDLEEFIKKEKLIKPYEENKTLMLYINIARLPYSFISNFK